MNSPFEEALLYQARKLAKTQQWDQAMKLVERVVGYNPSNLDGWLFLAYYSVGVDNTRAAAAWEHITRLRPYDDGAQKALTALREVLASARRAAC